jgi:hypothetical protein
MITPNSKRDEKYSASEINGECIANGCQITLFSEHFFTAAGKVSDSKTFVSDIALH